MKIKVYIQPGSKKSCYAGMYDGLPKIKIAAPPVDGAANSEVINYFSKLLDIPKKNIIISSGASSRLKILDIDTELSKEEIYLAIENG